MRRLLRSPFLVFSTVHFAVVIGLLIFLYARGMSRFDSGAERTMLEAVGETTWEVLASPLWPLWDSSMSRQVPNAVEWLLVLANSALWGGFLSLAYGLLRERKLKLSIFGRAVGNKNDHPGK